MVAPLDIEIANGGQHVQNLTCSRTTIEDITYHMQRINRQRMNKIANSDNQLFRTTRLNNRIDNGIVIRLPVMLLKVRFMQQFLDDISIIRRQQLMHFGTAVFDGHGTRNLHHLLNHLAVPCFQLCTGKGVFDELYAFVRIVYQRAESTFVFLGH